MKNPYIPPRYSVFRQRSILERIKDWAICHGLYKSREFADYIEDAKKIEAREEARVESRNVESATATHGDNLSKD